MPGSGAVGIEALSRGAAQVTFVERAPAALKVLRGNLARLGLTAGFQHPSGQRRDVSAQGAARPQRRTSTWCFSIRRMTRPRSTRPRWACWAERRMGCWRAGAVVIAEHRRKERLEESYGGLAAHAAAGTGRRGAEFLCAEPQSRRRRDHPAEPRAAVLLVWMSGGERPGEARGLRIERIVQGWGSEAVWHWSAALVCAAALHAQSARVVGDWAVHAACDRQSGDCAAAGVDVYRSDPEKARSQWEALHTFNPAAIVRHGKVVVLYRAEDNSGAMEIGGHTSRLGLAESKDGIHFKRMAEPVFYPAEDDQKAREWPGGVEDPRIVESEDGTYVLTYTQWNRMTYSVGIATSRDLLHWTKYGPAFLTARTAASMPT